MAIPVSRIGDMGTGICCCHPPIPCIGMTGKLITGASAVNANGIPISTLNDTVLGDCGHTGIMVSCSSLVIVEGLGAVRIGDSFQGCFTGTLVEGSSNVNVG